MRDILITIVFVLLFFFASSVLCSSHQNINFEVTCKSKGFEFNIDPKLDFPILLNLSDGYTPIWINLFGFEGFYVANLPFGFYYFVYPHNIINVDSIEIYR